MSRVGKETLSCTLLRVSDLRGQQTHSLEDILLYLLSSQQITQGAAEGWVHSHSLRNLVLSLLMARFMSLVMSVSLIIIPCILLSFGHLAPGTS